MVSAPAHPGLHPAPFRYVPLKGEWARLLAAATGAVSVERALHVRQLPLGYYRFSACGGVTRFGKVVHLGDATRLEAANQLTARLAAAGVPVVSADPGYRMLDGSHVLFLYDWVEGHFSSGQDVEMHSLGSALARLHAGLHSLTPHAHGDAMSWQRLEALSRMGALPGGAAVQLDSFLLRRSGMEDLLSSAPQPIHNDLHLGNILFTGGRVAAFLDFEEALHSTGNPLIDLSWVLERFCFLVHNLCKAQRLASAFLSAYLGAAPCPPCIDGGLAECMRWRALNALALLASRPSAETVGWRSEWDKFSLILVKLSGWGSALSDLEKRYLNCGGR